MPPTTSEKLQKVIAHAGLASRRVAEDMIRAGRVVVDGEVAHIGQTVDAAEQAISVDGVPLPTKPGLVYWLIHKPIGVISTADDELGRKSVTDLVPSEVRVYPVGRLDADSSGLLILTNDGDLTNIVTHPRYGVTKNYVVRAEGHIDDTTLRELTDSVELEDGPARAVSIDVIDRSANTTVFEMVMAEGRKREVRRMIDAIGYDVLNLFRSAIGPIRDSHLKKGEFRPLTLDEVRSIYEYSVDV